VCFTAAIARVTERVELIPFSGDVMLVVTLEVRRILFFDIEDDEGVGEVAEDWAL